MAKQIQLRRDTEIGWSSTNPILAQGEIGINIDTNTFKLGDGVTTWSDLDYYAIGETNTAVNLGTGEGTFYQKDGEELQFKSIKSDGLVEMTSDDDSITISVTNSGIADYRGFSNIVYLTYSGTSGTSTGEKGCTLTSPGNWAITDTNAMYYLDTEEGNLVITIPDASASNETNTLAFRMPNLAADVNTATLQTTSNQKIGPEITYVMRRPGDQLEITSNNFGGGGNPTWKWRQTYSDRSYKNVHTVAKYGGDFTDIQSAIDHINSTEESGVHGISVMPGVYEISSIITLDSDLCKSISGLDTRTVILKPTNDLIGEVLLEIRNSAYVQNITIDATDNDDFRTTIGSTGTKIDDDSYDVNALNNVEIKGFYSNVNVVNGSNLYVFSSNLSKSKYNITTSSGSLLDIDSSYIYDAENINIYAKDDSEVYIEGTEIYNWDYTSNSGIAVQSENEAYVELFGGTNIWGLNKNLLVQNTATIRVDSCVIEETTANPGIEQKDTSTLVIINSRAPLSDIDIDIDDPTNVYINSYDSTLGRTTIGRMSDDDSTLFSVNIGSSTNPELKYISNYYGYKGLVYYNPTSGQKTLLSVESLNAEAKLLAITKGVSAHDSGVYFNLYSDQSGSLRGWEVGKSTGWNPSFTFKYLASTLALQLNSDGSIQLNSGENVNKILDEDDMSSDDSSALSTQQAIKAYVDNTTYSTTALNNGQLDNRYYTESEVDTISGTIDSQVVKRDGTNSLTNDWDAGDYDISAAGFNKDDTEVDLASFVNITGLLTGGEISINADPTKLNVASGTSVYVDMSDRSNPVVETLYWDSDTIDSTLSGVRSKWVGIYRTGSNTGAVLTDTDFSQLEKRTITVLGRYWGNGTDTITGAGNYSTGAFNDGKTVEDIAYVMGSINISGNVISPSNTSMKLNRSAGQALRYAAGYSSSATSPNIIDSVDQNDIYIYQYHLQGSNSTTLASGIDPNYYDNSGVKTEVPADKWTVQRVYYFPGSDNVHVVYGQSYKDSYSLIYDYAQNTQVTLNEDILSGSILMAYLFLKQDCTDLTDTDQANIVPAILGEGGLLTSPSNHGELGGLDDDDHPQYLTLSRGDSYYPRTDYIEQSINIKYNDTTFVQEDSTNHDNVEEFLNHVSHKLVWDGITARTNIEEPLSYGAYNLVNVASGIAHIYDSEAEKIFHVTWSGTSFNTDDMYNGTNWFYVDEYGGVQISQSEPNYYSNAVLGYVFTAGGAKSIGTIHNSGVYGEAFGSRVAQALKNMGPFVVSGLTLSVDSNDSMKVINSLGNVQHTLLNYDLTSKDSSDAGYTFGKFLCWYRSSSSGSASNWSTDMDFVNNEEGRIPLRYNDTTLSGFYITEETATVNSGTNTIDVAVDITSEIDPYDFVQVGYSNYMYSTLVSGVEWTGSETRIHLFYDWTGPTAADTLYLYKAVRPIDTGKYVKHLILRTTDDQMHFIYGTEQFDTEDDAKAGALPEIPEAINKNSVNIAYIIVTSDTTSLEGNIYDIKPTPFTVSSAGGAGGGSTASDHGALTGLSDDDHTQYILSNGTRNFSGKISYTNSNTFSNSTDIVSKKYVDDKVVTDHGNLGGLSDDDHGQYSLSDGSRDYTDIVSYDAAKTFTSNSQIVDKKYVDDKVVTDHGNLSGLSDDDHNIYTKADGSRSFTNKVSYTSHPTFINDTEIVDKKYVDDGLSNLTTDHGNLEGLGDDDHTQYHNNTRGDARYYTQTQVNNAISTHHASNSTDHDDRYYTETESDSILTTLSGVLQTSIDNIETGPLSACQIRRTTDFVFPSSWGDVTFDTTDIENNTDVVQHNDINTERIDVKESGLYLLHYKFQVIRSESNFSYSRVVKNGSTILNGSGSEVNTYTNEVHELTSTFVANLSAGDYISLQSYENTTGVTTGIDDTVLSIISLKGLRGDQGLPGQDGAPGTGSTINISKDDSIVAADTSNLNFTGSAVTVTSGVSYTTVDIEGAKTIQCYSNDTITNLNSSTPVLINWNGEDIKDSDVFTHSTSTNTSRLTVEKDGWYEVSYNVYYSGASTKSNVRGRIRKNGTIYLGRGVSVNYTRNSTNASGSISSGPFLIKLTNNDYIELLTDQQGDSDTVYMVSGDNYIRLTLFRST